MISQENLDKLYRNQKQLHNLKKSYSKMCKKHYGLTSHYINLRDAHIRLKTKYKKVCSKSHDQDRNYKNMHKAISEAREKERKINKVLSTYFSQSDVEKLNYYLERI